MPAQSVLPRPDLYYARRLMRRPRVNASLPAGYVLPTELLTVQWSGMSWPIALPYHANSDPAGLEQQGPGGEAVPYTPPPLTTKQAAVKDARAENSAGMDTSDFRRSGSNLHNVQKRLIPANPARRYLIVQNQTDVNAYVRFGGPARPGRGLLLLPNGSYESPTENVPVEDVHIFISSGVTNGGFVYAVQGV